MSTREDRSASAGAIALGDAQRDGGNGARRPHRTLPANPSDQAASMCKPITHTLLTDGRLKLWTEGRIRKCGAMNDECGTLSVGSTDPPRPG